MNQADGRLTSPNFGVNDLGNYHFYDHNSNCTWILNADEGYYITLEIDYFDVNTNNDIQMTFICTTFLIKFIIIAYVW